MTDAAWHDPAAGAGQASPEAGGAGPVGADPSDSSGSSDPATPSWVFVAGLAAVAVYVGWAGVGLRDDNADVLGAALVVPVLVAATVPLARRIARIEGDAPYTGMLLAALGLKLIGALVRYQFAYGVYRSSDASGYHAWGEFLAPHFRRLDFGVHVSGIPGTGFIRLLTGVVYAVAGASRLGGFVIFSWIGFLGLVLCWRAFRTALPDGDGRRYFVLVLLLPSLLYWPSSLGKEAWMIFALGLAAYGASRSVTHHAGTGLPLLGAGLLGAALVRPHVALVVLMGLAFALFLRRPRLRSPLAAAGALVLAVGLLVGGLVVVQRLERFLGVESLTAEVIDNKLDEAEGHTTQGGSEFTPVRVSTPLDLPYASVTVLYRPFPTEVKNAQALIASIESMILLAVTLWSLPRLRQVRRLLRERPYVAYCAGFVLSFIVAFSAFGNFGLLVRQRVQVLPAFLVLLCLPRARDAAAETDGATEASAIGQYHL